MHEGAWLTKQMQERRNLGLAAVARLAGVSTATVSNTLNRPHMVAPETQERVQAAIKELDFVPNRAAATLRQGSNRLIGLVIPDVANPFYAAIVDAVVDAADRERYAVALCVSHDDPARELRHFDLLAEQRAAGALVVPVTADSSRLSQLRMIGSRLILVDRLADDTEHCSVSINDIRGGEIAVAHLLESGPERQAPSDGSPGVRSSTDDGTAHETDGRTDYRTDHTKALGIGSTEEATAGTAALVASSARKATEITRDKYGRLDLAEPALTSHSGHSGAASITLVNGARSIAQCEDRRSGARKALATAGLDPNALVEFEVTEMTVTAGIAIGRRIASGNAPRRIFCTNDQLAVGVIIGLEQCGIATPAAAKVIGYGDLGLIPERDVSLTTVGQQKREMGAAAVGKLLVELRDGAAHRHSATVFEPRLIVRNSTANTFDSVR